MPAKKVRVEILNNGDRYTITFEGQFTREKALRLLDLVELLGGMPAEPSSRNPISELPKIEKIRFVVEKKFPIGWFFSRDVQAAYEEQFSEPVRLSTVSTYLSRLADHGILIKGGAPNKRRYKVITTKSGYQVNERR